MSVEFINSEIVKIDGNDMVLFKEPISLLNQIQKTLEEIGAEKFYSSTDENVKKVRESLAGFFFTAGINKFTNKYWWLMQPKDTFPDFIFMAVSNNPMEISLEPVELVEIPPRCQSFDEAFGIIQDKFNKGYPENSCHLLIYINHTKSQEWLDLLQDKCIDHKPFKGIWTVHLLFRDKNNLYSSVVHRIKPDPIKHAEVLFSDPSLYQGQIPDFMERIEKQGKVFIQFKQEVANEFTKALRKLKLGKK